jgi:asparagine synthase (glutamine-hydrolysing)
MNSSLLHRGPDAEGLFMDNNCGLAHRRLSIIDISERANLPMTSHCGRYVIVYNGEVYNFKEIRQNLINNFNSSFSTESDTEVILEAYSKFGIKFIEMLNGMFAIAIYDNLKQELLLVRDRLGIKPIFYFFNNNTFVFASEIKALFKANYIKQRKKINYDSISDFLHLGYIPQPTTFYENIFKFPAGNYAYVNSNGIKFFEYWNVEKKLTKSVLDDYVIAKETLKKLLQTSVEYRMIADVPFGTFLSGGIDSSLVTAIAQSLSSKPIKTFSIGFKEAKFNETNFAKNVANFLKTEHSELFVDEKDAQMIIPDFLNLYDEPFADTSAIPTMLISKLAKNKVSMILSGEGGDELFYGYGAYKWAERLSNPLINFSNKFLYNFLKNIPKNKYRRASLLFDVDNQKRIKSHIFSQEQYYFSRKEINQIIKKEYNNRFSFKENYMNLGRDISKVEEQALFDLEYYLRDDLLTKYDRATMKYSLEGRVPLLDYRIVEFALNLSASLKIKNNVSKFLLKEVLYDYIPKEYFNRPKWGFSIPLNKWLQGDLKYLITEYLNPEKIEKIKVLNKEYVNDIVKQYLEGREYLYNRVWLLIVLVNYLEK